MSFAARKQGLSMQDRQELLGGWSSSGGESTSSRDYSGSHSEGDDVSSDYDGVSSLEDGPPSLEYSKDKKASTIATPSIVRSTHSYKRSDAIGDTPATADLTCESTSGSENDGSSTPKVNLNSRMKTPKADNAIHDQAYQYTYEMEPESTTGAEQPFKTRSTVAAERERKVRRSKSADSGRVDFQMDDYQRLAETLGLPVSLFTHGANNVKQKQPGKASGRSSLSTSLHSSKKSKSRREPVPSSNDKKSSKSKRRSSMVSSSRIPTTSSPVVEPVDPDRAAKVAEKEKAMNRLERIKAKAIKSATKELGVDEANLAAVMGVPSSSVNERKKAEIDSKSASSQLDDDEEAEMLYLAQALGLPPAMFGIKFKADKEPLRQSTSSSQGLSKSKTLFSEAIKKVKVKDVGTESEDDDSEKCKESQLTLPQDTSSASALGITSSPSTGAPPIQEHSFQAQPTTEDEKRADKDRKMTRLERMKAKAIKSAKKELGVDEVNLAEVLGMGAGISSKQSKDVTSTESLGEPTPEETSKMMYLAETLGLPPSFFGIQSSSQSKSYEHGTRSLSETVVASSGSKKLFQEVIKKVRIYDTETETEDEPDEIEIFTTTIAPKTSLAASQVIMVNTSAVSPPTTVSDLFVTGETSSRENDYPTNESNTTQPSKSTSAFCPQRGSLTKALGMVVDPSSRSQPIWEGDRESAANIQIPSARKQSTKRSGDTVGFIPQPGSLAEVLGMVVDPSSRAPPIRQRVLDATASIQVPSAIQQPSKRSGDTTDFRSQPGSLAEALGMIVDPSSRASSIRQHEEQIGANIQVPPEMKQPTKRTGDKVQYRPQPGSLAEALGMVVDPSSCAPSIRQGDKEVASSILIQSVVAQLPNQSSDTVGFRPEPGSLAEALGMVIDASSLAPSIRQTDEKASANIPIPSAMKQHPNLSSDSVVFRAQPGSLAEALGMVVDPSSFAPAIRQLDQEAAANTQVPSAMKQSTKRTGDFAGYRPQPGSLAEALGMVVDPSSRAPPIRQRDEDNEANIQVPYTMKQPTKRTRDTVGFSPQPGSLAEALGMVVDPSSRAPPIRQREYEPFPSAMKLLTNRSGDTICIRPQSGSLAESLGMIDDPSSPVPSVRQSDQKASANISIPSVLTQPPNQSSDTSGSRPHAGSLAEALGIAIDPSSHSPAIRQRDDGPSPSAMKQPKRHTRENVGFSPQPGSLADALGMVVDPSSRALPIRQREYEPSPSAMKQFTNRSGDTVCIRPQPGNMAETLGMIHDPFSPASSFRQSDQKATANISIQSGMAQLPNQSNNTVRFRAQPGSLAEALGIAIDPSSRAPPIRQRDDEPSLSAMKQRTNRSLNTSSVLPQAGSLVEALGMVVDPSSCVPAIRQRDPEPSPAAMEQHKKRSGDTMSFCPQPGSLAEALGMVVDPSSRAPPIRQRDLEQFPSAMKQLSEGAGMFADPSSRTPSIRQRGRNDLSEATLVVSSPNITHACTSDISLHDSTDSCTSSGPVYRNSKLRQAGTLEDAIGLVSPLPYVYDNISDATYTYAAAFLPQQLEGLQEGKSQMATDSEKNAMTMGEMDPTKRPKITLFDAVFSRTSSACLPSTNKLTAKEINQETKNISLPANATIGVPSKHRLRVKTGTSKQATTQAQAGSLAAALGMAVHPGNGISPIPSNSTQSQTSMPSRAPGVSQAQAGSLAAALGMTVDSSSGAPPARSNRTKSETSLPTPIQARAQVQAGSLAAALGIAGGISDSIPSVRADPTRSQISMSTSVAERSQAQTGSLAAALGMVVDHSNDAPPVRPSVIRNGSSMPTQLQGRPQAQAGSLAAALGMSVVSSVGAPPAQSDSTENEFPMPEQAQGQPRVQRQEQTGSLPAVVDSSKQPKKNLFDSVLSSAASSYLPSKSKTKKKKVDKRADSHPALDSSVGAPLVRSNLSENEASVPPPVQGQSGQSQAVAGSLAAALGMTINASVGAPPVGSNPSQNETSMPSPVPGRSQAQAGSLAAALGMAVHPGNGISPIPSNSTQRRTLTTAFSEPQGRDCGTSLIHRPTKSAEDPIITGSKQRKNIFEVLSSEPTEIPRDLQESAFSQNSLESQKKSSRDRKSLFEPVSADMTQVEEIFSRDISKLKTPSGPFNLARSKVRVGSNSSPALSAKLGLRNTKSFAAVTNSGSLGQRSPVQRNASWQNPGSGTGPALRSVQPSASFSKKGSIFDAVLAKTECSAEARTQTSAPPQLHNKPEETGVANKGNESFVSIRRVSNDAPMEQSSIEPHLRTVQGKPVYHSSQAQPDRVEINSMSAADNNQMVPSFTMGTRREEINNEAIAAESTRQAEARQIELLADSLGLPTSFFGLGPKKPKSLFESAVRDVPTIDKQKTKLPGVKEQEEEDIDSRNADESSTKVLVAVPGIHVDPATDTPPVVAARRQPFKPQPVTKEDKRAEKAKAMTRLERMKAKALRSAQKELGVDLDGLASVMGMSMMKSENTKERSLRVEGIDTEPVDAQQMKFLAESLGLPPSFFGVQAKIDKKTTSELQYQNERIPASPLGAENLSPTFVVTPVSMDSWQKQGRDVVRCGSTNSSLSSKRSQGRNSEIQESKVVNGLEIKLLNDDLSSNALLEVADKLSTQILDVKSGVNKVMNELAVEFGRNTGIDSIKSSMQELLDEITSARNEMSLVKNMLLSIEGKFEMLTSAKTISWEQEIELAAKEKAVRAASKVEDDAKLERAAIDNTALELELLEKSKLYSEKLSELHAHLDARELEVSEKTAAFKLMKSGIQQQKDGSQGVTNWIETENRLRGACSEIQEFRSMLALEYEEIRMLRTSLEEERLAFISNRVDAALDDSTSSVSGLLEGPSTNEEEMAIVTSAAILNIQRKLQLEGARRRTLTARLKAKRKNQRKAVLGSSKLQDKLVLKLDEKAAERASPKTGEMFTFDGKATGVTKADEGITANNESSLTVSQTMVDNIMKFPAGISTISDSLTAHGKLLPSAAITVASTITFEQFAYPSFPLQMEEEFGPVYDKNNGGTEEQKKIDEIRIMAQDFRKEAFGYVVHDSPSGEDLSEEANQEMEARKDALMQENEIGESCGGYNLTDVVEEGFSPVYDENNGSTEEQKKIVEIRILAQDFRKEAFGYGVDDSPSGEDLCEEANQEIEARNDALMQENEIGEPYGDYNSTEEIGIADPAPASELEQELPKLTSEHSVTSDSAPGNEPYESYDDTNSMKTPAGSAEQLSNCNEASDPPSKSTVDDTEGRLEDDMPPQKEAQVLVGLMDTFQHETIFDTQAFEGGGLSGEKTVQYFTKTEESNDRRKIPIQLEAVNHTPAEGAAEKDENVDAACNEQLLLERDANLEHAESSVKQGVDLSGMIDNIEPVLSFGNEEVSVETSFDNEQASATIVEETCEEYSDPVGIVPGTFDEKTMVEEEEIVKEQAHPVAQGFPSDNHIDDVEFSSPADDEEPRASKGHTHNEQENTVFEQRLRYPDRCLGDKEDNDPEARRESTQVVSVEGVMITVKEADAVQKARSDVLGELDDIELPDEISTGEVNAVEIPEVIVTVAQNDEEASTETPLVSNRVKETTPKCSDEIPSHALIDLATLSVLHQTREESQPEDSAVDASPEETTSIVQQGEKEDNSSWLLASFGFIFMCTFASYVTYVGSRELPKDSSLDHELLETTTVAQTQDDSIRKVTPLDALSEQVTSISGEKRLRSALKRHAALKKKMTITQELTTTGSEFKNFEVPLMAMSFLQVRKDDRIDIVDEGAGSSDESIESGNSSQISQSSMSSLEDFNPLPAPSADLFAPSLSVFHRSMQPTLSRAERKAARKRRRKQFVDGLKVILEKELKDDMWM